MEGCAGSDFFPSICFCFFIRCSTLYFFDISSFNKKDFAKLLGLKNLFKLFFRKFLFSKIKILENKKDDIKKIVNNIADWVDSNDRINEAPGIAGGYEDSEYDKSDYKVKNGRFLSIAELLLVARIDGKGDWRNKTGGS